MAEKIFTIPINEAFDRYEGCPLCYLKDKLEDTTLTYCLGAAMMEPDVRIQMNQKGFCHGHLNRMSSMKNKLGLALILESRLEELKKVFEIHPAGGKKTLFSVKSNDTDGTEMLADYIKTCFVCDKLRSTEVRYLSNTVYLWEHDSNFKTKLLKQPFFCVSHAAALMSTAKRELKSAAYSELYTTVMSIESKYFEQLTEEIKKFCDSFDHRNTGKPMGEEKHSIERAVSLLK